MFRAIVASFSRGNKAEIRTDNMLREGGLDSREVLKELCCQDLLTSTLFKIVTLMCFVLHEESNSFSN